MKNLGSIRLAQVMQFAFGALTLSFSLFFLLNLLVEMGVGDNGPLVRGRVRLVDGTGMGMLTNNPDAQLYQMSDSRVFFSADTDETGGLFQGKVLSYIVLNNASWIILLLVFYQLTRILRDIHLGAPFDTRNIRRIRLVGAALIAFPVLRYVSESLLFRIAREHAAFSQLELAPSHYMEWLVVCVVVGLLVLAGLEVLKYGRNLQQEQALTI